MTGEKTCEILGPFTPPSGPPCRVGLHLLGAELVAPNLETFIGTSPQSSMN
jgi:hypothetical protein